MSQTSLITVWLDQIDKTNSINDIHKNCAKIYVSLCEIDRHLITFRHSHLCFNYINGLKADQTKVILIITSENTKDLSESLLRQCEETSQIQSVYIISLTKDSYVINEGFHASTKIRGYYFDIANICNQLIIEYPHLKDQRRNEFNRDDFCINSLPSISTIENNILLPTMSDNSPRQEADFMYSCFLRDILIKIDSTEKEMIEFCRNEYANSEADLNIIDEFETYYESCNAIFWFTRDTFLFRLLNRALRELNINILYSLRYFIKDLHLQLEEQHFQQIITSSVNQTVYRGQLMDNEQFDKKIRYSTGSFFSVSSFFSTTSHENLACTYAGDGTKVEQSQSVLFYIEIDQNVNQFPYADITQISIFGDAESEILFTMGAVFRILSVNFNNDNKIWYVKLKLTSEEDQQLKLLSEYMRLNIFDPSCPMASLAKLMMTMGHSKDAQRYHLQLLENNLFISDCRNFAFIYSNLGLISIQLNERAKANEYFQKSIGILLEHLPQTDPLLAVVYNNLGENYREQGYFDAALSSYNRALDIYQMNMDNLDQNMLGILHNNIGLVYSAQHRYSEALQNYEKSIHLREKYLPSNHPDILMTYNNIGLAFYGLEDYVRATEYHSKILLMQQQSLPENHPDFGRTYNNLGTNLHKAGKLEEALNWFDKSLQSLLSFLPSDHPDIARYYNNIGVVYCDRGEYTRAIDLFNKAIEIRKVSLAPNHPDLAATYYSLATTYHKEGALKDALNTYEKALRIWINEPIHYQSLLSKVYNNMSLVYYEQSNYDKQIEYISKALEIQKKLRST